MSAFVRERIAGLLDQRRVVVWYDGERAFGELVEKLALASCSVVLATVSPLTARRQADGIYRDLDGRNNSVGARQNLLIYVPRPRATGDARGQDPFEGFARSGVAFGSIPAEELAALAQLALPARADEIARLSQGGRLSLALLDGLVGSGSLPRLSAALGTESTVHVLVAALGKSDIGSRLAAVAGSLGELTRLVDDRLGLAARPADDWDVFRKRLAGFILLGELALDQPNGLPSKLAGAPHALGGVRQVVFDVLDRLRETDDGREAYVLLATAVEADYQVAAALENDPALGSRDTFASQDEARLKAVIRAASLGDLASAQSLAKVAESSVWGRQAARRLIWTVVRQCMAFLEIANGVGRQLLPRQPRDFVSAYVAADGFWQLDRAQRRFEQASALSGGNDDVEPLVAHCRARYRTEAGRVQAAFQASVLAEGWPPEATRRQTQVFDAHVAPELSARQRVAFVLVDSLRYELGRDLAEALEEVGSVAVESTAAALPTSTPFGMAALLPGADGALLVAAPKGTAVPAIGETLLPNLSDRKAFLTERIGDRYADITLDEFLGRAPRQLATMFSSTDLLVVRSRTLDSLGEGADLFLARRIMSEIIGDLVSAARRLAGLGFRTIVFAADHGHVLVPEILPGDVVTPPAGDWLLEKRRSRLGRSRANAPGSIIVEAAKVGIAGSVAEEIAFAEGFKTFEQGSGYFHEGLSLQECVVPVVVLKPRSVAPIGAGKGDEVSLIYRSNKFTSSVVSLKVKFSSVVTMSLAVRIEAFDGPDTTARKVGIGGDCDGRDEKTGEITLRNGVETTVPVVVDSDFTGDWIEVRAIEPRLGIILNRLSLSNGRMD